MWRSGLPVRYRNNNREKRLNGNEQIEFLSAACGVRFRFFRCDAAKPVQAQLHSFGQGEKQEIALEQDYAQMRVQQARLANHEAIRAAAEKQNLHPPVSGNTFMVEHQR